MKGFLDSHPIIDIKKQDLVVFFYMEKRLFAPKGIMLASALIANGIDAFRRHYRDGLPQGIFCANGQCAQCLLLVDGVPVKACVTALEPGMRIEPLQGLPEIDISDGGDPKFAPTHEQECDVLIVGGGPAGLSAAIELGQYPLTTVLVDDKPSLGGKLTLQTHQFFGSISDCYAGSRGTDIAAALADKVRALHNVKVYTGSTAAAVFEDGKVGISSNGRYTLVRPRVFLNASGARERTIHFPGSYLPNIYGAGAFQTILNRDLVKAADRLLIVGSGNVGLIAAYHALQADIRVVCVLEALPSVTGYRVHRDKILRLGVPILTSHTILRCSGTGRVEYAEFAEVDENLNPKPGTERAVEVDAVLIGVGLVPANELSRKAREAGIPVFEAGDAEEVSEASAAFFGGKVAAGEAAGHLIEHEGILDPSWREKISVLKSKPGRTYALQYPEEIKEGYMPVLHCYQRIPCNPCVSVCPKKIIYIPEDDLLEVPRITGPGCIGCFRCVAFCPGLAVTLVRRERTRTFTYIPYEMNPGLLEEGSRVMLTSYEGDVAGEGVVRDIFSKAPDKKRRIIEIETDPKTAIYAAGIRLCGHEMETVDTGLPEAGPEFVCICEHITRREIEHLVDEGITDVNLMKALERVTMGACGGKTCSEHIKSIMKEKNVPDEKITENTERPFFLEIKFRDLANLTE